MNDGTIVVNSHQILDASRVSESDGIHRHSEDDEVRPVSVEGSEVLHSE